MEFNPLTVLLPPDIERLIIEQINRPGLIYCRRWRRRLAGDTLSLLALACTSKHYREAVWWFIPESSSAPVKSVSAPSNLPSFSRAVARRGLVSLYSRIERRPSHQALAAPTRGGSRPQPARAGRHRKAEQQRPQEGRPAIHLA